VSVIVDTDLGRDDVVALALLTGRKDVRLRAVTVSGTGLATCPSAARRAARFLRALGQRGVPVSCGPDEPLKGLNAFPVEWRADADRLARGLAPAPEMVSGLSAPDLLADAARRSPGRDVLLTLGPLTNVAEALRRHPELKGGLLRVVSMVGAVRVPGNVGPGHDRAEMNAWVDPVALQKVLDSGVPITLVPLDATNEVPIDPVVVRDIGRRSGAAARLVTSMLATQTRGNFYFWDPLAAAAVVDPLVVRTERMRLSVFDTSDARNGALHRDSRGAQITVAVGARAARFHRLLVRAITRNPTAEIRQPVATINVDIRPTRCDAQALTTKSGDGWVRARNRTRVDGSAVFAQLRDGKTVEDVRAFLRNATSPQQGPPSWVTIRAIASAPAAAQGWGDYRNAPAGTYVIVCLTGDNKFRVADRTIALK
jgi:pyrimidine-specific ribonucleoside hydrolase